MSGEFEKTKDKEIQNKNIIINDNIKLIEEETKDDKICFNDIICPYCYSTAIITNNDNGLDIINCDNFHHISNISYNRFEKIDSFPSIKCSLCSSYKSSFTPPMNQFYKCICGEYIFPEYNKIHAKDHNKIEIENQNYQCIIHNQPFNCYCVDCNMNLCHYCFEPKHSKHEIIKFIHLLPKENYIGNIKKEVEEQKKI